MERNVVVRLKFCAKVQQKNDIRKKKRQKINFIVGIYAFFDKLKSFSIVTPLERGPGGFFHFSPTSPNHSRVNPDAIPNHSRFFYYIFSKKICVYQKKALPLQSKLNKKYHKTENGLDTLQLMKQNADILQANCASSLTRGVLFC